MKLVLPKIRKQLSPNPLNNMKPLSKAESRCCYRRPNTEFDAVEHHLAGLASPAPEAE
jgi:hypothetical protein